MGRTRPCLSYRFSFAATLVLIATASTAVSNTPDLENVATIAWPTQSLGAAGTFTRMVSGDLNGDGFPDAVGLSGTRAAFFEDIGIHTAVSGIPMSATDIAIAPLAEPTTHHDALAVVNSSGLQLVYLEHAAPPGLDHFVSSLVVANEWAGAVRVRSADLNGTGVADYVGVTASGKTLLCLRDGQSQTSLTLSRSVLDLAILRWSAGVPPRIAVLTSAGVFIYDQEWNLIESFGHAGVPGGAIAVIYGASPNKLAWVMPLPSGDQQIFTLGVGGVVTPGTTIPSTMHVVAVTAGDVDGDGAPDLVLSQQHDCMPYFCDGASAFAAAPVPILVDSGLTNASGLGNYALPLVADLDLDGYADVVMATQPLESYCVLLHGHPDSIPQVSSFFQDNSAFHPDPTNAHRTLRVAFTFPSFPSSATHVELLVWKQLDGPSGTMEEKSFDHAIYLPVAPMAGSLRVCEHTYDIEVGDDGTCFPWIYWIELRPAKLSNGDVIAVAPSNIAALTVSPTWVAQVAGPDGETHPMWSTPECFALPNQVEPGPQRPPSIVPKRRLPNFEPPNVPTPRPLDPNFQPMLLTTWDGEFPLG